MRKIFGGVIAALAVAVTVAAPTSAEPPLPPLPTVPGVTTPTITTPGVTTPAATVPATTVPATTSPASTAPISTAPATTAGATVPTVPGVTGSTAPVATSPGRVAPAPGQPGTTTAAHAAPTPAATGRPGSASAGVVPAGSPTTSAPRRSTRGALGATDPFPGLGALGPGALAQAATPGGAGPAGASQTPSPASGTPTAGAATATGTAAPLRPSAAHRVAHDRVEGGLPLVDSLDPRRAPAWLRPILYALLGLAVASLVAVTTPSRLRRRLAAALTPGAADAGVVAAAPTVHARAIFQRFWPFARPYRRRLLLMLLLVPIPPALQTAEVLLFKRLVDHVLVPHDFGAFPLLAGAFVAIALTAGMVSFVDDYLSTLIGERFILDLRTALFRHVQGLGLDFFERRRLGDVLQRLTGDTAAIEDLMLSGVSSALSYLLRIAFFVGALVYIRWDLAVVSLAVAPLFLVVARHFARLRKAAAREKRRRNGAMSTVAEEALSNAQVVQAFNREDTEVERFRTESLGSFAAQMAATRLRGIYGPIVQLIELAGVLLIVGLGTWELSRGWLTLGGLLAFLALLSQLYRPVRGLGRLGSTLAAAAAGAERVLELLNERPSVQERSPARTLARARGTIEFRSVGFRYPDTDRDAVADVSFRVGPGETLALVGPSGAGKSTLTKLLLRFYDPTEGAIELDGTDLRDLTLESLRRQVAAVFQETLVFDATIAENVAYGRPGARRSEIEAAARAAGMAQFVTALPRGLDSVVGEKGRALSGGQRQRVAIARAFLRNSPILLLDEPTTGLDDEIARRILEPLRRLAAERTTILVSHDLSLVRDATRIVALDRGRVVDDGTHAELVEADGLYRRLAEMPDRRLRVVNA